MDYQRILFDWSANQPAITGAVILGIGLLSGFLGYRMIRFLLVVSTGGIVAAVATMASLYFGIHPLLPVALGGLAGAILGFTAPRPAIALNSGLTLALLAGYITSQLGLRGNPLWITLALVAASSFVLGLLSHRTMTLVITTLHGSALMIIGFVGLSSEIAPSIGATFVKWGHSKSLVVPLLLTMVTAMAYSVQVSKRQGDICTGT
jgi:hypothetical protein